MRLIDADALIERLKKDPLFPLVDRYGVVGVIQVAPTIEAEPVKHGRWINNNHQIKCSICGKTIPIRRVMFRGEVVWEDNSVVKYCPNCGATMGAEEGAEE